MICGDPRILREDIVQHTKEVLGDSIPCPNIVDATLRDAGGLYGAMALLKTARCQNIVCTPSAPCGPNKLIA
jgi:hypothetical protein